MPNNKITLSLENDQLCNLRQKLSYQLLQQDKQLYIQWGYRYN